MWCDKCHFGSQIFKPSNKCPHCGSQEFVPYNPLPEKPERSIRAMNKRKVETPKDRKFTKEKEKVANENQSEIERITRGRLKARDYEALDQ